MAQKINLNSSPYYDDFDSEKNFHRVLYKPGFPVQARELTTQQSILQNQVEKFGDHIFKDGSVVIPGGIAFDNQYNAVKLNSINLNVDISVYIKNYLGKKIIGSESGIEAVVKFVSLPNQANITDVTLYVTYLSSDNNFQFNTFTNGESLSATENVVYGNTTITAGTPFASLISEDATSIGSAAFISKGVYFVRGFFVNVSDQTIILDDYTNNPSYRVGLQINETLVNAKEDNSLFDNAKGFTNFAAPGADRLKIELILSKKLLSDNNDTNFIELMRVDEGKIKVMNTKSDYNKIRDWIAERTFDESGDYTVEPFRMGLFNSLNDGLGNNGLFFEDDTTDQENTPSDDLMCLKLSAGEAYVRGYDIEKVGTTIIDVDKPRDVGIKSDIGIGFEMGNILKLNNVTKGVIGQGDVIKLFDNFNGEGENIGSARVYSFNLEDAPYEDATTRWELRLFDIQTNTDLTLNNTLSSAELPLGSFIKGKSSGASGFSVGAGGNSTEISLNQTSGSFSKGEQIQINGVDFPRTIGIVTEYTTQSIKSVRGGSNFEADTVVEKFKVPNGINIVNISSKSGGISTITAGGLSFSGLRKGSVVRYNTSGINTETFNKVESISSDGLSVAIKGITNDVTGVYNGDLPTDDIQVSLFAAAPIIRGSGRLYAPLSNSDVSSVDLTDSTLKITKQLTGKSASNNQLTLNVNEFTDVSDVIFDNFDQERYSLFNNIGVANTITNATFKLENNNQRIVISDIADNDKTINVTLTKTKVKSKLKVYNRSQKLNVTRSKLSTSGSVSAGNGGAVSDGLVFDARYGLRVQDEEISLNYPDVIKFLSVYESTNTDAPTLDKLVFTSTVDVTTNAVIGENIIGVDNKINARVVGKPSSNTLEIVYLTAGKFNAGDSVKFSESSIKTEIESIEIGSYKNITNSFTLDKGQKDEYYDYSRLVRNKNVPTPSRQLLIVFDYYSVPASDDGDVFTVSSYDQDRFSKDIPTIGSSNIRASDTFDFRPRVSVYDPSSDSGSPFEFRNRDFSGNSILRYLTPNESSIASFEHYLPRIDKVYLNKFGDFIYEKGIPSIDPKPPIKVGELMELASIGLPAYLYNTQDAVLTLIDNRRFTMRDIGDIEDRVTNLEETTTLSLLEVSAQTLQIQDEEGRNRFKTGFFVDPFKNYNFINTNLSSIQINPQAEELIPFRTRDTLASQLTPAQTTISSDLDFNVDFELLDSNVKKTGNVVTLNYEEVEFLSQPYATKTGEVNDTINVNPYELPTFLGKVELDPQNDTWTRTVQLPSNTIEQTGKITVKTINMNFFDESPSSVNLGKRGKFQVGKIDLNRSGDGEKSFSDVDETIQNNLVSSRTDDFMRSRNIQFISEGFADFAETFLFIDGQKITDIIPKLLEITPTFNGTDSGSNGQFNIGEEVHALDGEGNVIMKFRVCQPDHKSGRFNNPTEVYFNNPYTSGVGRIPQNYSPSSTVLNVDTKSLSEEAQGKYFGYVEKNSQLVGQESGATAYVKNLRLVTDAFGELIGSCFIRDPHSQPAPSVKIQTGVKEFKLTTSPKNENVEPAQKFGVVFAKSKYSAFGTIEEWQDTITLTTNTTTFKVDGEIEYTDPLAQTFVVGGNVLAPSAVNANKDLNGIFVTAVEVYFATVDTVTNSTVRCEIRSTIADARPSTTVIGRSKTLKPKGVDGEGNEVTLIEADSESASKATKFTFPEPIYLAPGKSYAFVLVAPESTAYTVWTGRHGGIAVNPDTIVGPDSNTGASLFYSTQYGAGAIFKSQNGALWTEDQSQDITFKIYKAKFTSQSGSVFFNNPDLSDSNGYVSKLLDNPILTLPKTGSIGITTNITTADITKLVAGRKISATYNTSTAVIVGTGASVVTAAPVEGLGGTDYKTDTEVDTFTITGKGSGLKLNIQESGGVILSSSVVDGHGGSGYQIGDVVGIVTSTVGTRGGQGKGARISIGSTGGIDTLFLTNIQGDAESFKPNNGVTIKYFNDVDTTTPTGTITQGGNNEILSRSFDGGVNAGNVIKVNHFNHGMYSSTNKVKISDIESDVEPTILTSSLLKSQTSTISVGSTSQFANFEGLPVSATNIGYVKIGTEIIGYQSVGTGVLNIGSGSNKQRGVDGTIVIDHNINSVVKKHEISGVSIRRLEIADTSISDSIGLDHYHVTFDRASNGKDRSTDSSNTPQLSFNSESFVGGSNVKASQNILYGAIIPRYDVLTPTGLNGATTGIQASIRTTTGTSVDGQESSFVDKGFQTVQLNSYNSLDSVRLVASKVNENEYLASEKSFTTVLNFTSNDENISPIVKLSSGSETEFINHRLNNPIGLENYDSDNRVNSVIDDPHSAEYISNTVVLNNPATSLKVLLSAFRPSSSDFRVLFSLVRADSSEVSQAFELFPGFKNVTKIDGDGFLVTDESKNDGRPDTVVTPSKNNEFKEYQFTADNLPEFVGFTIKIVMSGTNQAQPPRIRELRAIAVK